MGKLIIHSLFYKGTNYFYKNNNFRKGINYLVGDNENGKSTFTYLIVYALGLNVDFFNSDSKERIAEISNDTNNTVELGISLNSSKFTIRRKIGESIITVHDPQEKKFTAYSISRQGYVYKKEEKNFSDWMLEELGIEKVEITQNSGTHRINFEDLMRFIYYDQITDNRKIVSEFGINSSDFYRNSNIMKRSIFEILMSGYNKEYYKVFYKLKNLNKELQIEKENLNSLKLFKNNILSQVSVSSQGIDQIQETLKLLLDEIDRLERIREEITKSGGFGEEVTERLIELQRKIVALTHKIKNLEFEVSILEEEIMKSKRVYEDTRDDIEKLDKILFTSQFIDIIDENKCPFCLEPLDLNEGHCICGSAKSLDFSRFIYSDKEYLEIMKAKIKTMETIRESLLHNQSEYHRFVYLLKESKNELEENIKNIKTITNDLEFNVNYGTVDEITYKLNLLRRQEMELGLVKKKNEEIKLVQNKITKLEKNIALDKRNLDQLAEEKERDLQKNIEKFETTYSSFLNEYYGEDEFKHTTIKLDRNYLPVFGEYKHQSFNVAKRLFYHLTMLKMSLDSSNEINYPKFLIIDTLKDEGIELNKLKRLFKYFEEFKNKDCQLIITCGCDEFEKELEPFLIDRLSNEEKLLKSVLKH